MLLHARMQGVTHASTHSPNSLWAEPKQTLTRIKPSSKLNAEQRREELKSALFLSLAAIAGTLFNLALHKAFTSSYKRKHGVNSPICHCHSKRDEEVFAAPTEPTGRNLLPRHSSVI